MFAMARRLIAGAIATAAFACAAAAWAAPPRDPAGPPTAEDFGRLPAIASLTLSPDGKRVAAVTSPDGVTTYVSIWSTDAMGQTPRSIAPSNLQRFHFVRVRFVKNDRLAVTFQQYGVGGFGDGSKNIYDFTRTIMISPDLKGLSPEDLKVNHAGAFGRILNLLPGDPRHILTLGNDPLGGFGIYKLDVYTGIPVLVQTWSDKWQFELDGAGEPRARCGEFGDESDVQEICQDKNPKTGAWEDMFHWYAKDRRSVSFAAVTEDPNILLLRTDQGRERQALVNYDIGQHKVVDTAFEHSMFDAGGVVTSQRSNDQGRILGYEYNADIPRTYWTDGRFEALERQLRAALKVHVAKMDWIDPSTGAKARIDVMDDFDVHMVAYSDDLSRIIVVKSGPRQPPEYWLLADGNKLHLLGQAFPTIDPAKLGHTRLIEYAARDGLIIPAFVTTPPETIYGKGPYPAIVLPHGGPWGRDELEWDPTGWTQYFAARGYVVIQPQFRGSTGWGQKLWRAGDREWGKKMSDDIDDSAKWLIAQGLATPGRIAIHGYSFGGYSAFAAAVRNDGLYRCAIAGAGVAEIARFRLNTNTGGFETNYQGVTVDGLSPLDHTDAVTIPVMAYHGDADHTVPVTESRRFTDKLKGAGKPYRYVEFPNMGHQLNLWTPLNKRDILAGVDDFLKTDCKLGGG
jgi:dipeptidyl aminopeptidase/acylaminoacyl peptidase